jgi:hypothetical protein
MRLPATSGGAFRRGLSTVRGTLVLSQERLCRNRQRDQELDFGPLSNGRGYEAEDASPWHFEPPRLFEDRIRAPVHTID